MKSKETIWIVLVISSTSIFSSCNTSSRAESQATELRTQEGETSPDESKEVRKKPTSSGDTLHELKLTIPTDFPGEDDSINYNQYRDGMKHGWWKESDTNVSFSSIGFYVDDKANGPMRWYFNNRLAGEGPMKNGKRHGLWKVYAIEDGVLVTEVYFENDQEVKKKGSYE